MKWHHLSIPKLQRRSWKCIGNFIPRFTVAVNTYPCWGLKSMGVNKRGPKWCVCNHYVIIALYSNSTSQEVCPQLTLCCVLLWLGSFYLFLSGLLHWPLGQSYDFPGGQTSNPELYISDVIMSVTASQITGVSMVCSTVCSVEDQENIKALRHWPLWGEFAGDRWIPLTKGM